MKEICLDPASLSDYALELLSRDDQRRVELHVSSCNKCRLALQNELRLIREIRWTVRAVSQPDQRRIRELAPTRRDYGRRRWAMLVRQQFAPLAALAVILLSGWFWQAGSDGSLSPPSSTPLLETAIATMPHAASPMAKASVSSNSPLFTIAAMTPSREEVLATPAPHPTLPEKLDPKAEN